LELNGSPVSHIFHNAFIYDCLYSEAIVRYFYQYEFSFLFSGGILRKTAFTTFGLLAATSLCYPNEAVSLTTEQYEKLKSKILEFKNSMFFYIIIFIFSLPD
jgi:hypothetical protein